jgi:hypothetical protein
MEPVRQEKFEKLLGSQMFFRTLQETPSKGVYTVPITTTGYADLLCTVSELLRLCITVAHADDSSLMPNPQINMANLLEIALQLLPLNEGEFLDECYRLRLSQQQDGVAQK